MNQFKNFFFTIVLSIFSCCCFSQGNLSIEITPENPIINDDIYLKTDVYFNNVGSYVSHNVNWQGQNMIATLYYHEGGQSSPTFFRDSISLGELQEGTYSIIARLMVNTSAYGNGDPQNFSLADTDTIVFRVEEELGIMYEIIDDASINLFPNPANNKLNFQLTDNSSSITLNVFDIAGKKIKTVKYINQGNGEFNHSVDISNLSEGVYFCKFSNGKKKITRKFVKID
jgi:hypothetical protein